VWRRFFVEPFRESENSSRGITLASPVRLDGRLVAVMVVAALSLLAINYLGRSGGSGAVVQLLGAAGLDDLSARLRYALEIDPHKRFHQLAWWVATCVVFYFVPPALVVKLGFRERLRDYGMRVRGVQNGAWIYGVFFVCMLPAVYLVSRQPHFLRTYPFYRLSEGEPLWPYLVCWEVLYALQFVALEFFFRGFMVHGTKQRLGFYSVFAMMVPYCMIHFQKPLLECLGAIVAGIVLGTLSLKTRSIWLGAALHVGVAWTMDGCALYRQGYWG
jgi:membrane protease YdiL (CAAX protease family)